MNSLVAAIVRESNAHACVGCGKCSAACSMAAMYPDFSSEYSPRGMAQRSMRQVMGHGDGVKAEYLWRCLQCGNCTAACPEKVDCAGLIARLRGTATDAPEARACRGCGREMPAVPVREWLQNALDPDASAASEEDAHTAANTTYLCLCPVCRRQVYAANNAVG